MLIEFRVENHRSLKTEQVLTMEAGRVDGDDTIPRTVPGYSKPLLPVAALYGANASGKSNVLSALAFMQDAVMHSHSHWKPNSGVPRDSFAWGAGPRSTSMFEISFVQDETRYRYGFVVSNAEVEEEWLHAWPKGRQQTWFERESQKFTFGDHLKGERRLIQDVTRRNALFLSTAAQHQHAQLFPIASWFNRLLFSGMESASSELVRSSHVLAWTMAPEVYLAETGTTLDQDSVLCSLSKDIVELMKGADLGITDIKLSPSRLSSERDDEPKFILNHQTDNEYSWLPLEEESRGTKSMFHIALKLSMSLRTGNTLLVDELEASLHPKLAIEIIKQFNNPQTNPKNAQLIFTTHDTNLLGNDAGEPVLRRDQVWLTEKDKEGATTLYPLTDFKPRKPENLERGYLQGRYGAIPYLGRFSLASETSK